MKQTIKIIMIAFCGLSCSKASTERMMSRGNDIDFKVELVHVKKVNGFSFDSDELLLDFSFWSFPATYISFDYTQLFSSSSQCCENVKDSLALLMLYDKAKGSRLLIENSDGNIADLACNYPIGTMAGKHEAEFPNLWVKQKPEYWRIDDFYVRKFRFFHTFTPLRLYVCNDNPMIRFHYVYIPDRKARIIGAKPMILVSNWVNIRE